MVCPPERLSHLAAAPGACCSTCSPRSRIGPIAKAPMRPTVPVRLAMEVITVVLSARRIQARANRTVCTHYVPGSLRVGDVVHLLDAEVRRRIVQGRVRVDR